MHYHPHHVMQSFASHSVHDLKLESRSLERMRMPMPTITTMMTPMTTSTMMMMMMMARVCLVAPLSFAALHDRTDYRGHNESSTMSCRHLQDYPPADPNNNSVYTKNTQSKRSAQAHPACCRISNDKYIHHHRDKQQQKQHHHLTTAECAERHHLVVHAISTPVLK